MSCWHQCWGWETAITSKFQQICGHLFPKRDLHTYNYPGLLKLSWGESLPPTLGGSWVFSWLPRWWSPSHQPRPLASWPPGQGVAAVLLAGGEAIPTPGTSSGACFLPVCTVSIPLLGRLVAIRTASKTPTCLDFCFTPLRSKCQENYTSYPNGAAYKSILSETFLAKPVQWNSRPPEQKYYRSWQGTSIVRQLGVMKAWPMISWRPWTNIEGSRSPMSRGCSMSYALWICF